MDAQTKPKNQDFEAYADHKPFNYVVNPVWEGLVNEVAKGASKRELRILDYGCGDGKLFPNLVRMGFDAENIYGIEVSQKREERCHSIGFNNAQFVNLNQPMPFASGMFDIINYLEVIEHVPAKEIDFYLGEMARVMKPDGAAIITTPNYPIKRVIDIYYATLKRQWSRFKDDPTHVTFYNHRSLYDRLNRFFESVEVKPYKLGPFYSVLKHPVMMHKMVAICRKPRK